MKNAIIFLFTAASFYAKAQSFTSVVADSIEAVMLRHVDAFGDAFYEFVNSSEFLTLLIE